MTAQEFVHKWKNATLSERSASQQHFLDICALIGHPTPADLDKTGESFTFEKGTDKTTGKKGFADVWKRSFFGWEYKGNHADLDKAYQQLLTYRESLENPPLLVVSDMNRILIHTNFTNTVKRVIELTYDDLLTADGLVQLKRVFVDPDSFKSVQTTEGVTAEAAAQFAKLSDQLRTNGAEPDKAAHFLIRLLFCLFAEDVGLLPNETLKRLIEQAKGDPDKFAEHLSKLFGLMAEGGDFGFERIPHFNGSLFDDNAVLPLDRDALDIVERVSRMDWGQIEPSIFGTLFERSLDPAKRSQLGAHYTSKEDILLIVEPVLMRPLRRRWEEVRTEAEELLRQREEADTNRKKDNQQKKLRELLLRFSEEIAETTVLDPACGSGNFLYVALRELLDLQKEVIQFTGNAGLPTFFPSVDPSQLHGIEINPYAHELASATIWMGYIQWLRDNGFGFPPEPILRRLDTIENRDALVTTDVDGKCARTEWPKVNVIIGNPPFLGGKMMRTELGSEYVNKLFGLYEEDVPSEGDLVVYWFEKARRQIEITDDVRVGLISTNSIRGGVNRKVLDRIKATGDIFLAWSDRPWLVAGASVRVSMIGFDSGFEIERVLDGNQVQTINGDLTSSVDITAAKKLAENRDIAFMGDTKGGAFDVSEQVANSMLRTDGNPNGKPNSDVVVPWINASDVVRTSRNKWIIDFGTDMSENDAAQYELPFEYVLAHVKPVRENNRRETYRKYWWRHVEPRPKLREATKGLGRYVVTPAVSKHRLFAWSSRPTLPDHALFVFVRDDDYFFGALHSFVHELWSLRMGTWLGKGNDPRYTPTSTFETFPFPYPPGTEPIDSPNVQAIAEAARELVEKRDRWLNPEGATETELKKRTLTNLYNERPTWLDLAHKKLDRAVFDAYGWPHDIGEEEILERLLALNLERSAMEKE